MPLRYLQVLTDLIRERGVGSTREDFEVAQSGAIIPI
jgi:hypothetical protein